MGRWKMYSDRGSGCGLRGGYCELVDIDPDAQAQLFKAVSAKLCPTVSGQAVMDVVVNPPQEGEESYELFQKVRKIRDIPSGEMGKQPDLFYAEHFLEEAGVCVVPGSGFGQRDGTYHFRMTILPSVELIHDVMDRFKKFHANFMEKYGDGESLNAKM
eukprot:XP_011678804.1 PREDICTED: alanine aminotransferase 2-like [Strongylocentrotus purpuratus]